MKVIGSRLCDHVDHGAGVASVFRVERVGEDAEFFDAESGVGCTVGQVDELIVGVAAIHAEVVGAPAAAVHRNHAGLSLP